MSKIRSPNPHQLELIEQLKSLVTSYRREMPIGGKSTWPVCIRERVEGLAKTGMSYRQISLHASIPYDTVVSWPVRKTFTESGFVEIKVNQSETTSNVVGIVTSTPTSSHQSGFRIYVGQVRVEGLSLSELLEILSHFNSRAK